MRRVYVHFFYFIIVETTTTTTTGWPCAAKMDEWQRSYGNKVRFLCVSCAGPGLALEMSKEMKLRYCENGFIEKRHFMPKVSFCFV